MKRKEDDKQVIIHFSSERTKIEYENKKRFNDFMNQFYRMMNEHEKSKRK